MATGAESLAVRDVVVRFGGIVALDGVSFDVPVGKIVGLIGPNGAGKTTMFNCLSRLYTPDSGEIEFGGQSILSAAPHQIAPIGIGRTFQNLALFQSMTVRDNIRVGAHCETATSFVSNALRLPWVRTEEEELNRNTEALIDYLELGAVADIRVSDLPFGTKKRVELARALAGRPKLLLLDEPAGGLNHEEVEALGDVIKTIRDQRDVTVLLVEHHMGLVMSIADQVVVLDFGRKIAEGTPAEIQKNPDVIAAYLGGQAQ